MKRIVWILLACSVIWLAAVPAAWSAGFLIFEQGSKAMGMAGAFTATADDPSAIFNNPAGITQLEGTQISIGNTFIRNRQTYEVDSFFVPGKVHHEEMQTRTFFLPHLYVTQQMGDNMTFGFGYYTPFGIGTNWSNRSVGNSIADEAHIKTYDFNPNIALKIMPQLSVSVGVHYIRLNTQIIRQVGGESFIPGVTPVASSEILGPTQLGRLKLDARGGGWAYNLGLLYDISDDWKAGFSYRAHTKIEIGRDEGSVEWWPSGNTLASFGPLPPLNPLVESHTEGTVKLHLPGIFLAGISTTVIPKWTFEFDAQYTTWNHFDDLVVDMRPGLTLNPLLGLSTFDTLVLQEDWKNTWGFHFGTEYKYTENFAVRAGYFYDKNPIPDRTLGAILPDSDRNNLSLGCGYTMGNWTLDAAYMYSHFKDRSTDTNYQEFDASYKTDFHLLGITLTKKL